MSEARFRVAPSILAADFGRLADEVRAAERGGADLIHIDVMDGHFVPNISFGPGVVTAIRRVTSLPLDVHLMIAPVDPYLAAFHAAGADVISVHVEAGPHVHRSLQSLRSMGVKVGLAVNPGTPASAVAPVAELLDQIIVMTVNPGFGGQSFLTDQLRKIVEIRSLLTDTGRTGASIEVDGGVTAENAGDCIAAGADILVAGSAIFSKGEAGEYGAAIQGIRTAGARGRG